MKSTMRNVAVRIQSVVILFSLSSILLFIPFLLVAGILLGSTGGF